MRLHPTDPVWLRIPSPNHYGGDQGDQDDQICDAEQQPEPQATDRLQAAKRALSNP